jgi:hypothetical protein
MYMDSWFLLVDLGRRRGIGKARSMPRDSAKLFIV